MCHHRTPTQRAAGPRSLSRRSAPAIGGTRPIWSKRSRYIPGSVRAAVATAAAKSFVSFMVHHRDHNDDNNPVLSEYRAAANLESPHVRL